MEDTFTSVRIEIDPATKEVRPLGGNTSKTPAGAALEEELRALNAAHRALKSLPDGARHPPAPVPVHPARSEVIVKLKEQGNAALSKKAGSPAAAAANAREALKLYDAALAAALERPAWEASGLVREEAAAILSNRAQAHLALRQLPEAAVDAEASIELKPAPGQGKAWWRRVKALVEMHRWDEAQTWCERGLGVEPQGSSADELKAQLLEIHEAIKARDAAHVKG